MKKLNFFFFFLKIFGWMGRGYIVDIVIWERFCQKFVCYIQQANIVWNYSFLWWQGTKIVKTAAQILIKNEPLLNFSSSLYNKILSKLFSCLFTKTIVLFVCLGKNSPFVVIFFFKPQPSFLLSLFWPKLLVLFFLYNSPLCSFHFLYSNIGNWSPEIIF